MIPRFKEACERCLWEDGANFWEKSVIAALQDHGGAALQQELFATLGITGEQRRFKNRRLRCSDERGIWRAIKSLADKGRLRKRIHPFEEDWRVLELA